jgi:hypothetical protein
MCSRDKLKLNEKRQTPTMETMKNSHKGQTVIETALMIFILFILFFGIAEVARFWWIKNQINNAARVGVRVAIVDTTLTGVVGTLGPPPSYVSIGTCSWSGGSCTSGAAGSIQYAACSSITNEAACTGADVSLIVAANPDDGKIPGGIVVVRVTSPPIGTIVPGLAKLSLGLIPVEANGTITLTSDSTMRHE